MRFFGVKSAKGTCANTYDHIIILVFLDLKAFPGQETFGFKPRVVPGKPGAGHIP